LANGDIKILTGDEHQFWRTINVLEEQQFEYHKHPPKKKKKCQAVILGLHPETDLVILKANHPN